MIPTVLYEVNDACITPLKVRYIKGDRTKHISPKFYFTLDLQKNGNINIKQVCSSHNLANLITKVLPTVIFEKLVRSIGVCQLKDLD